MNLFNLFDWISRRTEEAILAGVARAVARIDGNPANNDEAELPAELRIRLALPPSATGEPTPQRNGRRKDTAASS